MLRSLNELEGYTASATDGDVGSVVNFLFDDERWAVRYLVVQTGSFFRERKVLITPIAFRDVDWAKRQFHVASTVDKIRNSPSVDADRPVSRQHERDYCGYYGYPVYWPPVGVWGMASYPGYLAAGPGAERAVSSFDRTSGDVHLRSAVEVHGYSIEASDGELGFVADLLVDDETWAVRYFVIDTGHWWKGHKVLVAPHWASRVRWEDRKVFVNLSRTAIKNSPAWDPAEATARDYEASLHEYYGRRGYWAAADVGAPEGAQAKSGAASPSG